MSEPVTPADVQAALSDAEEEFRRIMVASARIHNAAQSMLRRIGYLQGASEMRDPGKTKPMEKPRR